jgi:hypothetical protein
MNRIFKVKCDVLLAERDNILYVLDIESGRVHQFNETAKVVFQLCMEPVFLEDVVREYALYFGIAESDAREDVLTVIRVMKGNGLFSEAGNDER